MDVDTDAKPVSYCGPKIVDGKVVIVFNENELGTNAYEALELKSLLKTLNEAPGSERDGLSFAARTSIREDYTPNVAELLEKVGKQLGKEGAVKFEPGFEEAYAKLKAESQVKKTGLSKDWEGQMGSFIHSYFESVPSHMAWKNFEDDDLLQEGFLEEVSKGVIAFRIVDKLKYDSYCEVVLEDGTLFVQTTPQTWGSNTSDAAQKLVEQL